MKTLYDAISAFLQLLGGLSALIAVFQLIKRIFLYFKTKRYVKTTLMFAEKQCYISQAIYKKEAVNERYDFVTLASMECFQKLQSFLHKYDYKIIPFSESYSGKNVIHMGGPVANINVNSLFVTKFKKFFFYTPIENKEWNEKIGINEDCIRYTDESSKHKLCFKIGNEFLDLNENTTDYGIFIRIPRCRKNGIEYTTHIIFGAWAQGTITAINFFIENYKMIAKKYKNNKYCFAVKISRVNNKIELLDNNSIKDLTNEFFSIK